MGYLYEGGPLAVVAAVGENTGMPVLVLKVVSVASWSSLSLLFLLQQEEEEVVEVEVGVGVGVE